MPTITNGKSIAELDAIITEAMAAKQALADEKIEKLLIYIEEACQELDITSKQLNAALSKRKRKARTHKDNGGAEE